MDDDLIEKDIQFYGFKDFFENKEYIKKRYDLLSLTERRIYKMYVYSTSFETEFAKDLIWEFLNNTESNYLDLGIFKEYAKRMRRK